MEILEIVKTLQAYTEDVVAYKLDSEFAHAVVEAVALLIEQGERLTDVESKWIPVTERLPKPFEIVLVYDRTGKSINWAYMTEHREWVGAIVAHIVTHWMPLPEPPKGVE